MRYLILLYFLAVGIASFAQKVRIHGDAPGYVGQSIEVQRIGDYLSDKTTIITSSIVEKDSTFSLQFYTDDIEKIIIKANTNWSFLYVQPDGNYSINFPDSDPYEPMKASGNQMELLFYDLDTADINYKILTFQRWVDDFIGLTYHLRNDKRSAQFAAELDTFKTYVQTYYDKDTSANSYFLKTFVRFSIAGLDNINSIAERNPYEKYDFYLSKYPVSYTNDVYMEYLTSFYDKIVPRLSNETNELFYQGVINSSPTLIFNGLASEYTLRNPRIRELVMIQALSEAYYSKEYPKTNIETILDSLSQNSLFEEHEKIAKNILARLTDLVPGSQAPNFVLKGLDGSTKTLNDFSGKHTYLHFMDANNKDNIKELEIIQELHEQYSDYVNIITLYKIDPATPKAHEKVLKDIPWTSYALPSDHAVFEKYQINNYSQFVLIDAAGYIVASPALTPTPNGQYETIDRTFYYLKRAIDQENSEQN